MIETLFGFFLQQMSSIRFNGTSKQKGIVKNNQNLLFQG